MKRELLPGEHIERLSPLNDEGMPTAGYPIWVLRLHEDPPVDEVGYTTFVLPDLRGGSTDMRLRPRRLNEDLHLPGRPGPIPAGTWIGEF